MNANLLIRALEDRIISKIQANKVIILTGARRVGKTILLKQILSRINEPYLFLNGEDMATEELLQRRTVENYKGIIGNYKLLVIDEAQKLSNIGEKLKLMVDEIPELKIIVSGSSSFDLVNKAGEPLTGRKYTYVLHPLSESEILPIYNPIELQESLRGRLLYGGYPELLTINSATEKVEYLREMVNSYLLKDLLELENVRNSNKMLQLLRLIAFQIGNTVSYQELGTQLGMSKNTVERYLDLFSKVFIIHRLDGFSRNLRKEISKSPKWYFYDNGIRNAIIANFNPPESRNDMGQLWENYILAERLKFQQYEGFAVNNYFWRTYDKQEIDLVEERGGELFAYEFKLSKARAKVPPQWKEGYAPVNFSVINSSNHLDFTCKI